MRVLLSVVLAFSTLCSGLITAQTIEKTIVDCSHLKDKPTRLACYDAIVLKINHDADANTANPAVSSSKIESFGAEHLTTKKEKDIEQVRFIVASLTKNTYGQWHFTFENDQQWQQSDNGYLKVAVGDSVLLTKGALNAIYLKKARPNSNKTIRVKRIK